MQPIRLFSLGLSALVLAAAAHAAPLAPYQQAALKKMLATFPAEQRATVQPQLEAALAGLTPEQVNMMLASFSADGQDTATVASPPQAATTTGEWGAAEADFEKAFASAQGYIGRVSDTYDAARARWDQVLSGLSAQWLRTSRGHTQAEGTAKSACERELNILPRERSTAKSTAAAFAQQDRIQLRQMVEYRARYDSFEKFAKAIGQLPSSPNVQPLRHYFAAPLSESEVKAKLASMESALVDLLDKSSREQHRIDLAAYPDDGHGVLSPTRQRDLQALRTRTEKAAAAICQPGLEAYQRGLVSFVVPVVSKVRPHFKN